jgi:hypothetical protein
MRTRLVRTENRKWWTVAVLSLALFMIMLDNRPHSASSTVRVRQRLGTSEG